MLAFFKALPAGNKIYNLHNSIKKMEKTQSKILMLVMNSGN